MYGVFIVFPYASMVVIKNDRIIYIVTYVEDQSVVSGWSVKVLDAHINIYACGVMVIVVGNGHGDISSNPGPDWLHFT